MDEKGLLVKRSKRCMATILGFKEKYCDTYLPPEISDNLRKVVLDEINDLCELVFDILDEDVIFNEDYFVLLEEIHAAVINAKIIPKE